MSFSSFLEASKVRLLFISRDILMKNIHKRSQNTEWKLKTEVTIEVKEEVKEEVKNDTRISQPRVRKTTSS